MYRSTDSTGAAVAVTGAYIEPTVQWWGGALLNHVTPLLTDREPAIDWLVGRFWLSNRSLVHADPAVVLRYDGLEPGVGTAPPLPLPLGVGVGSAVPVGPGAGVRSSVGSSAGVRSSVGSSRGMQPRRSCA